MEFIRVLFAEPYSGDNLGGCGHSSGMRVSKRLRRGNNRAICRFRKPRVLRLPLGAIPFGRECSLFTVYSGGFRQNGRYLFSALIFSMLVAEPYSGDNL